MKIFVLGSCGGDGMWGVIALCGGVTLEWGGVELATMLFILLQLIQVLTPGSNLINFYEDQKEVGVGTSFSHK